MGENIFGYYYHSVNGISYGLAQTDPIKRRPLCVNNKLFLNLKKTTATIHPVVTTTTMTTMTTTTQHVTTSQNVGGTTTTTTTTKTAPRPANTELSKRLKIRDRSLKKKNTNG
jgi:hypothetical protein